jgi:hypothetical protein
MFLNQVMNEKRITGCKVGKLCESVCICEEKSKDTN